MNDQFYLLQITLCDTKPTIWRRVVVPTAISLDRLHDVNQIIQRWQDAHLQEFVFGHQSFTEAPDKPEEGKEEALFRLCDVIQRAGQTFTYLYDFGDSWQHNITL